MRLLNYLTKAILLVSCVYIFVTILYIAMGQEIKRREAEHMWYVEKCSTDKTYYPEFCKELLTREAMRQTK